MTGSERGFTIIEVVLFLAITGGLFAALMVGVGVGITQQRYLDTVRSYKGLLQDQYSAAVNTRNEDVDDKKCSDTNDGSIVDGDARTPVRGTSRCVVLGRAIQVTAKDGKTEVTTSSVTGFDPGDQEAGTSDSAALGLYLPKLALFDKETTTLAWDGSLTKAEEGQEDLATALILILRSPTSGSIVVYTSPTNLNPGSSDLTSFFDTTTPRSTSLLKACVSGDSGLLPKQMVVIDSTIGGPDAVSTDGGSNEVCQR